MGCNIDKMLIKGIRSFSPDNQNVIEFYRPLTIIVGQNGAGKTTVIECLKMACTGELPPNTRSGQSFIHDPKVAGETEVKGQIKLRFVTPTRQPVVVIRSYQLTQKKATMQFKALDQVLQTINRTTGQKEALSYRCADIDKVVPSLMGVSKAILENVIFVHQEESNWPLAEGQVLKKKFDDIFAATKYTKALEALRKLRTEKTQEVKEMRLKLEHLKTNKDMAQKLRAEVEGGSERSGKLEEQVAQLEGEIAEHMHQMDELSEQLNAIADYNDEVRDLRARHDMLAQQNSEACARLLSLYGAEDLEIGVEELEAWERDLAPEVTDIDAQLKKLQREIQGRHMEVEALKEQYTRDVKNQGRLAAEAEAHHRNCQERDRFIREQVAVEASIAAPVGADCAFTPEALEGFRAAFQAKLREVEQQLETCKATNRTIDDDMGRSIDQVIAELSGAAEGVRMKQEQLRKNDATSNQLQGQVEACVVNLQLLEEAKKRESGLEDKLRATQDKLSSSKLDEQIAKYQLELAEVGRQVVTLRVERDRLAAAADKAGQMRYKGQELMQKEEQLRVLLSNKKQRLEGALGIREGQALPEAAELRQRLDALVAKRRIELDAQQSQLKEAQQKLATAEGSERALGIQLARARQELERLAPQLEEGLHKACEGQVAEVRGSVSDCAHAAEAEQRDAIKHQQELEAFSKISEHAKRTALANRVCITCRRPFASDQEVQAFIQHQDQANAAMPGKLREVQGRLHQAEQRVAALKNLQPLAHRHDQLKESEIPALEGRMGEIKEQMRLAAKEVEEAQERVAVASAELQAAQSLLQEVAVPAANLAREIKERQAEVAAMKQEVAITSETRTVGEVDSELSALDDQRARVELDKDRETRNLQRLKDELSNLRSEHQSAREEVMRLGRTEEKRAALEAQIAELGRESEALVVEIQAAQAVKAPLEEKRSKLQREREAKRAAARQREEEVDSRLRRLHTLHTQLQGRERAIVEYERASKAEALERINRTLEELKRRQADMEAEIRDKSAKQRELEADGHEKAASKRQIDDLLGYQRARAQQGQLGARLGGVEAKIGQVGNQAALQQRMTAHDGEVQALRSKRDHMLGSLATIQDNVKRAKEDLRHPNYDDIESRFRMQLIELKTTEMANSDLEKYHKALEKALLAFHTSKMADINKVVKELWQKTYRNSDIDYIAIKTDTEEGGRAARSYNYRVVMYCGGAELDMRGRCSAGQKVLACLIIRLALAETFCLNCGILALDEPTTNLDAANAGSLAESLRMIMTSRKDQENFQLVVITHDEQFAHLIGTREFCSHLWRITKDNDQHTLVSQEEILE